jgi:signal transduction histidine kinase
MYGILVGQTHQRIRLFIQTTSDKLFLRGKYDYYKELSDASTKVGEKLSLPSILRILYETFYNVVEVSNPRIFLPVHFTEPERTSERYVPYDKKTFTLQKTGEDIKFEDQLVKQLISTRAPILDPHRPDRELVVPCLLEDRLIAIFVLGRKLSEDPYTNEDIRLLEVLASQAAVALDHTRSYEKIKVDLEVAERQLARLTAGVTHEIRNPLTVIRSEAERLANQERDLNYLRQFRDLMLKHVDRIAGIVQRMLSMAKEKPKQEAEVDLNVIINSALQLITISRISLKKELNKVPQVKGDPVGLEEIFVNLIQNAIEAMPGGGTLILRTYTENNRAVAEVSDSGKGIPAEIQERIFDPFFSTRHEGVGLGLSIAYRIIREHGGDIKVSSERNKGTTFKILF